jgi:hypothetical protein
MAGTARSLDPIDYAPAGPKPHRTEESLYAPLSRLGDTAGQHIRGD